MTPTNGADLGPRQIARVAADYEAAEAELRKLRDSARALETRRTQLQQLLHDHCRAHYAAERAFAVIAGGRRFRIELRWKRAAPSYKDELAARITPAEMAAIIARQPERETFHFDSGPA